MRRPRCDARCIICVMLHRSTIACLLRYCQLIIQIIGVPVVVGSQQLDIRAIYCLPDHSDAWLATWSITNRNEASESKIKSKEIHHFPQCPNYNPYLAPTRPGQFTSSWSSITSFRKYLNSPSISRNALIQKIKSIQALLCQNATKTYPCQNSFILLTRMGRNGKGGRRERQSLVRGTWQVKLQRPGKMQVNKILNIFPQTSLSVARVSTS